MSNQDTTVLITGGSGFIASHTLVQALQQGYNVRTTLRSLKRADEVRESLRHGGATEEQVKSLQFFVADLMKDQGWDEATQGCTYVLHLASPFPSGAPKNEDDIIVPAREGTLRALRAAKRAGTVKRVVVTSSMAAIAYGHATRSKDNPYTEEDWTDLNNPNSKVPAYQKSKKIAEEAAWDFMKKEGGNMELATICPGVVFGPILGKDVASSLEVPMRLLNGQLPALPQITICCADVRDVAQLHLLAMTSPRAAGQRYIAVTDESCLWLKEVAEILKTNLPPQQVKGVSTRTMPNFVIRFAGCFDATAGMVVPELNIEKPLSNRKAKEQLGWQPRSAKEALLASAKSLREFGLVKN